MVETVNFLNRSMILFFSIMLVSSLAIASRDNKQAEEDMNKRLDNYSPDRHGIFDQGYNVGKQGRKAWDKSTKRVINETKKVLENKKLIAEFYLKDINQVQQEDKKEFNKYCHEEINNQFGIDVDELTMKQKKFCETQKRYRQSQKERYYAEIKQKTCEHELKLIREDVQKEFKKSGFEEEKTDD